jgi:predicted type IV restriction endonuclease
MELQKTRDVSEADTVTLVKDVMAEVFGFDKFAELTSEHAIKGTYCDLAVTIERKIVELVEVKSAGTTLDDKHVKQAVDYAANEGVDWVVLTNGSIWRLYQVLFAKPIDKRLLTEIDLVTLDLKADDCVDRLAPFMREGFIKGVQHELRDLQNATSRYLLSALILNNRRVLARIRSELHHLVDVLVGEDEILKVLRDEVIKRETMEGQEAEAARKHVNKVARSLKSKLASQPVPQGMASIVPADAPAVVKPPSDVSPAATGRSAG